MDDYQKSKILKGMVLSVFSGGLMALSVIWFLLVEAVKQGGVVLQSGMQPDVGTGYAGLVLGLIGMTFALEYVGVKKPQLLGLLTPNKCDN